MAVPLKELCSSRQRFWVESTPDAEAPFWHPGHCYMEVQWDRRDGAYPRNTTYGITGFVQLCNVVTGDANATPGESFRIHICASVPCVAQWKNCKYGYKHGLQVLPPLHVLQAEPPAGAQHEDLEIPDAPAPAEREHPPAPAEHEHPPAPAGPEHPPTPAEHEQTELEQARAEHAEGESEQGEAEAEQGETESEQGEADPEQDPPERGGSEIRYPAVIAPPTAASAHVLPLVAPSELSSPPHPMPNAPEKAPLKLYPPASIAVADPSWARTCGQRARTSGPRATAR